MIIKPKVRITPRYPRSSNKTKTRKVTPRPSDFSSPKVAHIQPTCQKSMNIPTTIKFCPKKILKNRQERIISQMLLSKTANLLRNITSKLFSILTKFFEIIVFFIIDTFELFLFPLIFAFFHNFLFTSQNLPLLCEKIFDHLLRYNISTTT